MAAPVNIDAANAVDITVLPYSITQNVHDGGTTYTVWYKRTFPDAGVFSIWGFGGLGSYEPTVFLYRNDPAGSAFNSYKNRPVYFPVAGGDVIYFKFDQVIGDPSPASLEVSLIAFENVTVPQGSLGVVDTGARYPIVLLSATADRTPLSYVPNFTVVGVEYGAAILPDGTLCLNAGSGAVFLCDANYANVQLVTTPITEDPSWIGTNGVDTFYVSTGWPFNTGPSKVTTISNTGVVGSTIWTLPEDNVRGVAPNPTETILYYIDQFSEDTNEPVRRWDLVNDVALSDLASGIDADTFFTSNILCLSDGTVIVGYRNDTAMTQFVRRYSSTGSVLNTYDLTYDPDSGDQDLLASDVTDASFWYLQHGDGVIGVTPKFTQFRVSDAAVLVERIETQFNQGKYNYAETATPLDRFGMPYSCPFWVTRTGVTPPPPPPPDSELNGPDGLTFLRGAGVLRNIPIVRQRRFPHLSDEQQRIFHQKLQIDIEAGVGTISGQGVLPDLRVRWSDDGGFTWSNGRSLGVGVQGDYAFRCLTFQLGEARDRIYEITQSDPVKTVWIAAYLDLKEGLK